MSKKPLLLSAFALSTLTGLATCSSNNESETAASTSISIPPSDKTIILASPSNDTSESKDSKPVASEEKPSPKDDTPELVKPLIGYMIYTDTGEPVGGTLGEKNADQPYNPASVTKIFIVNETLKRIEAGTLDPSKVIDIPHPTLISTNNEKQHGDALHNFNKFPDGRIQEAVTQATVENVIKAIMVGSSNIGCIALGDHFYGSEQNAVAALNKQAITKGYTNFQLANLSGFNTKEAADHHRMTAKDLVREMQDLNARVNRLKEKYPEFINSLNDESVTIKGKTRKGDVSYNVATHSNLVKKGPFHVPGLEMVKTHHTRYRPESRFGSLLIATIEVDGVEKEIAYLASGFPTDDTRDEWMHDKLVRQTPIIIRNDIIAARAALEEDEKPAFKNSNTPTPFPIIPAFTLAVMGLLGSAYCMRKGREMLKPQTISGGKSSAPTIQFD